MIGNSKQVAETYHNIVFIDHYDETVESFLEDNITESDMIRYLAQWDYGPESEHSPQQVPSHGNSDAVYQEGDYILSYNPILRYVGLDRRGRI